MPESVDYDNEVKNVIRYTVYSRPVLHYWLLGKKAGVVALD